MGEETKNAKRAVPQAMFWSIVANGLLGFLMVVTHIVCIPQLPDFESLSKNHCQMLKLDL